MRFSGTKYEKGNNIQCGNHYKRGAHRLRTHRSGILFFFPPGVPPRDPHVVCVRERERERKKEEREREREKERERERERVCVCVSALEDEILATHVHNTYKHVRNTC